MTESRLRQLFPNASAEFIKSNLGTETDQYVLPASMAQKDAPTSSRAIVAPRKATSEGYFLITISGQVMGGKNNMVVTRSGLHFPKKSWAKWRDEKVTEVQAQLPRGWEPISEPTEIHLEYIAGDRRRRDQPAIIDAIFHVLEKAGVVRDDTLLWISKSSRAYDKASPKALIHIPIGNQ